MVVAISPLGKFDMNLMQGVNKTSFNFSSGSPALKLSMKPICAAFCRLRVNF